MKKTSNNKHSKNKKTVTKDRSFRFYMTEIIIPCLIFLFTLGVVFYYIIFPSVGYLHSDCTDTILWARASYETGEWISPSFDYAAILPFGGNILMLVFMPFFGYSMATHTLGMILFALLLYFASVFFCRSLKMSNIQCAVFSFILFFVRRYGMFWGCIFCCFADNIAVIAPFFLFYSISYEKSRFEWKFP